MLPPTFIGPHPMKYLVLLATLFLTLSLTPPLTHSTINIRPLSWPNEGKELVTNHCTTWAFRQGEKVHWITAAHCVVDEESKELEDHPYEIGGMKVKVGKVDVKLDMVSLEGGPDAQGLPIAQAQGVMGDAVLMKGYPFGWSSPILTTGLISNPSLHFADGSSLAIYQLPVGQGDSGAAVVNGQGEVIGVEQLSFCGSMIGDWDGFCPLSAGSTLPQLKAFLSEVK